MEYIPELTWMMFVRLLDEKEIRQSIEAEATSDDFNESLSYPYRWQDYAWKDIDGVIVVDNKNVILDKKELAEIIFESRILLD